MRILPWSQAPGQNCSRRLDYWDECCLYHIRDDTRSQTSERCHYKDCVILLRLHCLSVSSASSSAGYVFKGSFDTIPLCSGYAFPLALQFLSLFFQHLFLLPVLFPFREEIVFRDIENNVATM